MFLVANSNHLGPFWFDFGWLIRLLRDCVFLLICLVIFVQMPGTVNYVVLNIFIVCMNELSIVLGCSYVTWKQFILSCLSVMIFLGASRTVISPRLAIPQCRQDPPGYYMQCLLNCEGFTLWLLGIGTISGSVCLTLFPLILYIFPASSHIIYLHAFIDSHDGFWRNPSVLAPCLCFLSCKFSPPWSLWVLRLFS